MYTRAALCFLLTPLFGCGLHQANRQGAQSSHGVIKTSAQPAQAGTDNGETSRNLAVWRSADSTIQKRAEAASRLAPLGTGEEKVEATLGRPTTGGSFNGPIIYTPDYTGPTNKTEANEDISDYIFKGGDCGFCPLIQ